MSFATAQQMAAEIERHAASIDADLAASLRFPGDGVALEIYMGSARRELEEMRQRLVAWFGDEREKA